MQGKRWMLGVAISLGATACTTGRQGDLVHRPASLNAIENGRLAQVKIWSAGPVLEESLGTEITVGFQLQNRSDMRLRFDTTEVWLESVRTDRGNFGRVPPVVTEGTIYVSPGGSAQAQVTFLLPKDIAPSDIHAFRVRWMARAASGEEISEVTSSGAYDAQSMR